MIACRVSIDGGTAQAIPAAPTIVLQATLGVHKPIRITRIQLRSDACTHFDGQNKVIADAFSPQSLQVSYGFFAGPTSGGATPVAVPVDEGLTGIYTPATTFKANTTTLGTLPFTASESWLWSTNNYFDTSPRDQLVDLQEENRAGTVWTLFLPSVPKGFNLTGSVHFLECG